MPSSKRRHRWTTFELDALLCLICRQVHTTGASSPSRIRKGRHSQVIFDLSKSIKHAHRDVADALNRALNYGNQVNDIPVEKVSKMIDRLLEERKDVVGYLERQGCGRITRGVKMVWNRGARIDIDEMDGRRKDISESFPDEEPTLEKASGSKSHFMAIAVGTQFDDGGFASGRDSRIVDSMAGPQDNDDPWGDQAPALFVRAGADPWVDEVAATMVDTQDNADPWDDEVMNSFADAQGTSNAWRPERADASMADAPDSTIPWAVTDSTLANTTGSTDSLAPWASTSFAPNIISPNDPWANTSSALLTTAARSDFISSQTNSMASVSVSSAPNHALEQDFTGINSERFAMLDASEECEDEGASVQEPVYASRSRGENAIELPFNHLARINNIKETSVRKDAIDDESEISEEE